MTSQPSDPRLHRRSADSLVLCRQGDSCDSHRRHHISDACSTSRNIDRVALWSGWYACPRFGELRSNRCLRYTPRSANVRVPLLDLPAGHLHAHKLCIAWLHSLHIVPSANTPPLALRAVQTRFSHHQGGSCTACTGRWYRLCLPFLARWPASYTEHQ